MSIRFLLALAAGLLLSFPSMADSRILTSIKPIQQITAALLDGIDEPNTWGICTRRAGKLYKARSRLYRSQILQVNIRWN